MCVKERALATNIAYSDGYRILLSEKKKSGCNAVSHNIPALHSSSYLPSHIYETVTAHVTLAGGPSACFHRLSLEHRLGCLQTLNGLALTHVALFSFFFSNL